MIFDIYKNISFFRYQNQKNDILREELKNFMKKIFDKEDIFISFNKKLSTNENIIFKKIVKHILLNNSQYMEFSENELQKLIKLDQNNNMKNFFENFMKKKILYSYNKLDYIKYDGVFYIISSYRIINNKYQITFSEDFYKVFNKESNDFKVYRFNLLLQFSDSTSRNFFMMLTQKNILNNFVDISLAELKKTLEIEKNYSRFYDFEKYILLPVIKEIKDISNIEIEYEKIKVSNNRKIIGLRLYAKDKLNMQLDTQAEKMMEDIESLISNRNGAYELIRKYIHTKGLDYVKKNIYYSKLHYSGKFDTFLVESIKYDYFSKRFKEKIQNKYNLIFSLEKKFKNLKNLKESTFEILQDSRFLHLSNIASILEDTFGIIDDRYQTGLLKEFVPFYNEFTHNLDKSNECRYEDDVFLIFIEFNGIYDSYIYIYKKF